MKKLLLLFALLFVATTISPVAASALTISNSSEGYSISTDYTVNLDATEISVDNSENTTSNTSTITISHDPSAYARLFVNDYKTAYVEYGGSAVLRWESNKMSSCTVAPTGQTGTNGEYVLQNITNNVQVMLNCLATPDASRPFWRYISDVRVDIKVLPPTFDYLSEYLSSLESEGSKKINLTSTSVMVEQAQKAYNSNKIERAQSFLQKSIDNLKRHGTRGNISADSINQYEHTTNHLSKALPISLSVATDGCSVTATGPAGLTLDYGSHELGLHGTIIASIGIGPQYPIIHGYLSQTTIPDEGTTTLQIPSRSGWTAFGKVVDSDGLIYALETVEVTTDCTALSSHHSTTLLPGF